jgi:DNA-binding response OmpR family regulator
MDKKKIFIVEDEAVILLALEAQLRAIGYSAETNEGEPTINAILDKIKLFVPNYLILDLVLPQVDGIELLKAIKADVETASIPVFIFTNYSDADTKARCQDLGAEYYFIKSEFNIDEFVAKFKAITTNLDKQS